MKARTARLIATSALALGILFATTAPASADHHLVKIREFSFGAAGGTDAFVELQMYEAGQNQMIGKHIRLCNSNCSSSSTLLIGGTMNPPNLESQRTVLIKNVGAGGDLELANPGLEPFLEDNFMGGAMCFVTSPDTFSDCVSWGTFLNAGVALPTSAGTPITGSLLADTAYRRSIGGGTCATALDAADDTDNSMADFAAVMPAGPTSNATTPTETLCVPPTANTPPGNPTSPINPAGHVRKRKCKKSNRAAAAKKKKCKKKKK